MVNLLRLLGPGASSGTNFNGYSAVAGSEGGKGLSALTSSPPTAALAAAVTKRGLKPPDGGDPTGIRWVNSHSELMFFANSCAGSLH